MTTANASTSTAAVTKKRKISDGDAAVAPAAGTASAASTNASNCACSNSPTKTLRSPAPPSVVVASAATAPPPPPPNNVLLPTSTPPAAPTRTFHTRTLPLECIAFSSAEGRKLFAAAIAGTSIDNDEDGTNAMTPDLSPRTNYMQIYFPLAEQFTTQAEPAFCGLATLAMCLNALHIDPGRIWKGAWRWFSEELLDCCTPLATAKEQGITLDQFVCLARCNGALATTVRADTMMTPSVDTPVDTLVASPVTPVLTLEKLRAIVKRSCASSDEIVVINYTRKALGQTGDGHFSPIGGYSVERDLVLLLDVARFKYPPHWVPLAMVLDALQRIDKSSGRSRGLVILQVDPAIATGIKDDESGSKMTPAMRVAQARAAGVLAPVGSDGDDLMWCCKTFNDDDS